MNADLQRIFETTPADSPRSRLEPYGELILRWRRQGRTYHRIRQLLADKFEVQVAYVTLYRFVQRRSRPRNTEAETSQPTNVVPVPEPTAPHEFTKLTAIQAARQRAILQALRTKAVAAPEPPRKERFEYDPDKPLVIDRSIKE